MTDTPVVRLRPTVPKDLEFVLALERHPDNKPFIQQWSYDQHADAIARPDREHWIVESIPSGRPRGYLIAYLLTAKGCGVYIKRIVVQNKSRGVGRAALSLYIRHAFDDLHARQVWLGTYTDNLRAQRCYRSVGFRSFRERAPVQRHIRAAGEAYTGSTLLMRCRKAARPPYF